MYIYHYIHSNPSVILRDYANKVYGEKKMEILLTRHGQTEWNLLKKVQGKADIELNETGM